MKRPNELIDSDIDEDALTQKTTYFKSVGMGLFDVCIAQRLMDDANQKGIGQQIEFLSNSSADLSFSS